MKISEIIRRIEAYHPDLGAAYQGCDGIKAGNPDQECTGVVSALVPTVEVIRKTASLGCNLLYVHEPTSYLSPDFPDWKAAFPCHIFEEKKKLLNDSGIVVYRDHDHAHAHRPDSIFTGVIRYLGWEPYVQKTSVVPYGYLIELPKSQSVRDLNRLLIEKTGANGIRYIGNPDAMVKRIALIGHIYPGAFVSERFENDCYDDYPTQIIRAMEENHIDAVLPGEVVEWNLLSYIRDASAFGESKVCFNLGHFNWEQLGSKFAVDWLKGILDQEVPITWIPTGDIWNFQLPEGQDV